MKYAAIAAGVFGLCILTFWFVYVRAPSPEEVCEHKIVLAKAMATPDMNMAPLEASIRDRCVRAAKQKIQLRGKIKYANYARCVMQAQDFEAGERCSTGS